MQKMYEMILWSFMCHILHLCADLLVRLQRLLPKTKPACRCIVFGAGAFIVTIVEFTLHVLPAVASQFPEDIGAVCNVAKRSSELTRNS